MEGRRFGRGFAVEPVAFGPFSTCPGGYGSGAEAEAAACGDGSSDSRISGISPRLAMRSWLARFAPSSMPLIASLARVLIAAVRSVMAAARSIPVMVGAVLMAVSSAYAERAVADANLTMSRAVASAEESGITPCSGNAAAVFTFLTRSRCCRISGIRGGGAGGIGVGLGWGCGWDRSGVGVGVWVWVGWGSAGGWGWDGVMACARRCVSLHVAWRG